MIDLIANEPNCRSAYGPMDKALRRLRIEIGVLSGAYRPFAIEGILYLCFFTTSRSSSSNEIFSSVISSLGVDRTWLYSQDDQSNSYLNRHLWPQNRPFPFCTFGTVSALWPPGQDANLRVRSKPRTCHPRRFIGIVTTTSEHLSLAE
jgi:hypothetical protein